MSTSPWSDLIAEAEKSAIWAGEADFVTPRRYHPTLYLRAYAYATKRMDTGVACTDQNLFEQQEEIFVEVARLIVGSLDWNRDPKVEGKTEEAYRSNGQFFMRTKKIIIRVDDGHLLEPPINMIARFVAGWS